MEQRPELQYTCSLLTLINNREEATDNPSGAGTGIVRNTQGNSMAANT